MQWAYGVTTVPTRLSTTLPITLESLQHAGFDRPHLFYDGAKSGLYAARYTDLDKTMRYPAVGVYGNWVLSLAELYILNPKADRYVIFQDDLVTCRNLRAYLDLVKIPDKGYLNLFTYRQVAFTKEGWHLSNQYGRGAVALVFTKEAIAVLLTSQRMVDKPRTVPNRDRAVDGAVALTMLSAGWKEWVHHPSLVDHIGDDSTIGNRRGRRAVSFVGLGFDASTLPPKYIDT